MASASAERAKNLLFARAVAVKPIAEREAEARAAAKQRNGKGHIVAIIFPSKEPIRVPDWCKWRKKRGQKGRSRLVLNYMT